MFLGSSLCLFPPAKKSWWCCNNEQQKQEMQIAICMKLARHNSPQEFDYAEIHSSNQEETLKLFATKRSQRNSEKAKMEWVFCFPHFLQTFEIGKHCYQNHIKSLIIHNFLCANSSFAWQKCIHSSFFGLLVFVVYLQRFFGFGRMVVAHWLINVAQNNQDYLKKKDWRSLISFLYD